MAWIMDTYSMTMGYSSLGVVTGKADVHGRERRPQRGHRAGHALLVSARRPRWIRRPVRGATVAVQGYGNAGAIAAPPAPRRRRARVVAVSDSKGGTYNSRGLDLAAVDDHKAKTGSLVGLQGRGAHHQRRAARGEVRHPGAGRAGEPDHAQNAARIPARIVAEAANGPTTPGADRVLKDHGVFVIPDILCNAGGVTVSYFEWAQNLQGFFWDEAQVNKELERFQ
jgi:glutamate dehydrogenase/leucine dehydrogenase